jgi:hypothetical protein
MSLLRDIRKQEIIKTEISAQRDKIIYIQGDIQKNGRYAVDQHGFKVDRQAELRRQQEKLAELLSEEQSLSEDPN